MNCLHFRPHLRTWLSAVLSSSVSAVNSASVLGVVRLERAPCLPYFRQLAPIQFRQWGHERQTEGRTGESPCGSCWPAPASALRLGSSSCAQFPLPSQNPLCQQCHHQPAGLPPSGPGPSCTGGPLSGPRDISINPTIVSASQS